MPDLPEVTQLFLANTAPYIADVRAAASAAKDFADANLLALSTIKLLKDEMASAAGSALALEGAEKSLGSAMADKTAEAAFQASRLDDLRDAMGYMYLAAEVLSLAEAGLGRQLAITAGAADIAVRAFGNLGTQSALTALGLEAQQMALATTGKELVLASGMASNFGQTERDLIMVMAEKSAAASGQGSRLSDLSGQMLRTSGAAAILGGAEGKLTGDIATAAAAMAGLTRTTRTGADTAAASGGMVAQWWAQWGAAVHWVVMGSAEILATAVPAMVALTAAVAGMEQTFARINDSMQHLYAASGGFSAALLNSVGPLHQMAQAGYDLEKAVAPDAYIIFGAVINSLTGHVGAFSKMSEQASNVLAQFATKLSTELSGPLGGQLVNFFASAVKYMIQWGQLLGNIGHTFVNAFSAMWGVGQVLLDVLNLISRALLAVSSNPVGAWFIGLAAAMSGVYRYAKLLAAAWKWLGGTALVSGIEAAIPALAAWADALLSVRTAADAAAFAELAFDAALGPVGWAILAVVSAGVLWYAVTRKSSDATDNLIASINKAPKTMANLSEGIQLMEGNLLGLLPKQEKLNAEFIKTAAGGKFAAEAGFAKYGEAAVASSADIAKSITEISKLANETINLVTGLTEAGQRTGQVGADMNAMAIQTALADSKIQSVNQALDQYIGILTGATSGNANFIQSMQNIGSVTATTGIANLGQATVTLSLHAKQFGEAMTKMGATGAAAWQNFDQVLSGSMEPLMDNLRQMGVVGALSGKQVSTAAEDMAVQLGRYAGSNKTAQASVMGFLRAQGLTFPSFRKFMEDATQAGAGQHQLNHIVDAGTIAFSKLSQMAKNAATAMNPMVSQAIDKAALSSSGFNTKLSKLQTDMTNHAPTATIVTDMQSVNSSYQAAIQMAEQTGNAITTNATKSSSGVHTSAQSMASSFDSAKLKQLSLQNQVQNSSQSIGSASHGAAGQVQTAMGQMGTAMQQAQQKAEWLQQYIDQMHGKTIQVNTMFTTTGNPTPGSGSTHGQHGLTVGFQGGGMVAGAGGVDAIHAMLTLGEAVLNTRAVAAIGGPLGVHTLNNTPSEAVLTSGHGGGGGGTMALNQHVDVRLDGSRIGSAWRTDLLIYNRRNNSANTRLRTR